jgi:hypothetical protein
MSSRTLPSTGKSCAPCSYLIASAITRLLASATFCVKDKAIFTGLVSRRLHRSFFIGKCSLSECARFVAQGVVNF